VIERTRDIGVLKSIGASRGYIVRALLSEAAVICALGIIVGFGLSFLTRAFFISALPTLTILLTAGWMIRAALIAICGGLLGASYPAWIASRKDVIDALAYD